MKARRKLARVQATFVRPMAKLSPHPSQPELVPRGSAPPRKIAAPTGLFTPTPGGVVSST